MRGTVSYGVRKQGWRDGQQEGDTMEFKWDYEMTTADGSKVGFVAHQIIHVAYSSDGYGIHITNSSGRAVGAISESELCSVMEACGESYW